MTGDITMNCPICANPLEPGQTSCAGCDLQLDTYRMTLYAPDILFNKAVDYIEKGNYDDACEKLAQANAFQKNDPGILSAWVYAAEMAGNLSLAVKIATDLDKIQNNSPEACKRLFDLQEKFNRIGTQDRKSMEIINLLSAAMHQISRGLDEITNKYPK